MVGNHWDLGVIRHCRRADYYTGRLPASGPPHPPHPIALPGASAPAFEPWATSLRMQSATSLRGCFLSDDDISWVWLFLNKPGILLITSSLNPFPICNCLIKFSEFYHELLYLVCNVSRFEHLFKRHPLFIVHIFFFCHSRFINLCPEGTSHHPSSHVIISACKQVESSLHFYEGQPGDFDLSSSAFVQSPLC